MKLFKVALLINTVLLIGCVTTEIPQAEKETRFSTTVQISEYNDIYSKYMYKPTFGSIKRYKNEDSYNLSAIKYDNNPLGISVGASNIGFFEIAIEKFERWNKQAIENGDLFEKTLIQYKPFEHSESEYHLIFHSGSLRKNFMDVEYCYTLAFDKVNCVTYATLDAENVNNLKIELQMFKDGKLKIKDIDNNYN